MNWIDVAEKIPEDNEQVIAFIPGNFVPTPGNPQEITHKPIKLVVFQKDFYGSQRTKHKNTESNHFWSGDGLSNHFFEEVTHWIPLPDFPL